MEVKVFMATYFITNDNDMDVNSKIKLDANMFNCVCTTLGGTEKELKDAKDYLRFNIKENQLQTLLPTLQSVSSNTNYKENDGTAHTNTSNYTNAVSIP